MANDFVILLDPLIKRWYDDDNDIIERTQSASQDTPYIFDEDPRSYARNNNAAGAQGRVAAYVFEAKKPINFKSLVLMKRFSGMRDRYQGMITKNADRYIRIFVLRQKKAWTCFVIMKRCLSSPG